MAVKNSAKRLLLINRDFQLRYVGLACVVGLVSALLTATALLYPLYVFEILRIPRFLPLPMLFAIVFAIVANIALVALVGVVVTHRIAGPMFALVRAFRRIEIGKWAGHLKIRDEDDLRYLVRNFNEMVDGLIETGKEDLNDLSTILADLDKSDIPKAKIALSKFRGKLELRISDVKSSTEANAK